MINRVFDTTLVILCSGGNIQVSVPAGFVGFVVIRLESYGDFLSGGVNTRYLPVRWDFQGLNNAAERFTQACKFKADQGHLNPSARVFPTNCRRTVTNTRATLRLSTETVDNLVDRPENY